MEFGVGDWRTRDGRKATVQKVTNCELWPLVGLLEGDEAAWPIDGLCDEAPQACDLVGPWLVEAEVVENTAGSSTAPTMASGIQPTYLERLRDEAAVAIVAAIVSRTDTTNRLSDSVVHGAYEIAEALIKARLGQ